VLSTGPFLSLVIASDGWRFIFLCLLTLNTAAVLLWSYYYMDSCTEYRNFISCLLTFLFSMVLVVVAGNFTLFFIG
jgi:NADH:ubiquinone oxidoreductase subunit 5 (subunit L)/multisubunit Na+/H+ antiporter MnhA subunit